MPSHILRRLTFAVVCFSAAACQAGASGPAQNVSAANTDIQAGQGNSKQDAGSTADIPPIASVKTCVTGADCAKDEDCTTDDGVRSICYKRVYPKGAGELCGGNGAAGAFTCGDGLDCLPGFESGTSLCTPMCDKDLECPVATTCHVAKDGSSACVARGFCETCVTADQCGAGGLCLDVDGSGQKYCTHGCTAKSTECPPYAACTDLGDVGFACVPKSGMCMGDGSACQPCNPRASNCGEDGEGACLHHPGTGENFCSKRCDAAGKCPTGYGCADVGAKDAKGAVAKQCLPNKQSCVKSLTHVFTKKNYDVMPDFAFVGYYDTNGNLDLTDESPELIKLSDFSDTGRYGGEVGTPDHKNNILFTISAGWCYYCREETKVFKKDMATLGPKGVVIVQVLYDNTTAGEKPTLDFLMKKWIKPLKAQGATVIDPDGQTVQLASPDNTYKSVAPPVNFVLDANSRVVLNRLNGQPTQGTVAYIKSVVPGLWTP